MTKILHIDSSPNLTKSHSRTYSQKVVDKIVSMKGKCNIIRRDLIKNQPPLVTEIWYRAAYKEENKRTKEEIDALKTSDVLIEELLSSDYIVIGSPMHNFSISSALKLYIDQIVRINKTWNAKYEGLLKGKKVYIVLTRGGGGYEITETMHHLNHDEPQLRAVLGFMGIRHDEKDSSFIPPHFIKLNNLSKGEDKVKLAYENADEEIAALKL